MAVRDACIPGVIYYLLKKRKMIARNKIKRMGPQDIYIK